VLGVQPFKIDQTVGTEAPWEKLQALGPKIAISRVLVQSVRSEELSVPIESFQTFAERATNTALAITDQLVEFLQSLAASQSESPVRRQCANEALGYICSREAAKALWALGAEASDLNTADEKISKAKQSRDRL
jgi:hypothetical protein